MKIFKEKKVDCLFITSYYNRTWFSKYPSSMGYMFVEPNRTTYFLDSRYYNEAIVKLKNMNNTKVVLYKTHQQLKDYLKASPAIKRLGYEDFYMSKQEYDTFKKLFKGVELIPIGGPQIREVKTAEEVEKIEKAIDISIQALHNIKHKIKPGITEKSIDIILNAEMKKLGAEKESFDSIIASGHRGDTPHAAASDKIIEAGEWVTIDFGALYQNYCADITRTIKLPGPNDKDKKMQEIFNIVEEAQKRGIAALKPGMLCSDIDKICRDYITSKGFGEYFAHGTGHGLGIEIHEEPYVSPNGKKLLVSGNVVTVEPGIYIPKFGGVRIEDDILITDSGHRKLGTKHHLIKQGNKYD